MELKRDPNHELTAVGFRCNQFRDGFTVIFRILNTIGSQIINTCDRLSSGFSQPAQAG